MPDSDTIEICKEAGAYEKIEFAAYIIAQIEIVTFPGYVGWYSERIGWIDPKVKLCESILKRIYERGLIEQAKNHAVRMGMRLGGM